MPYPGPCGKAELIAVTFAAALATTAGITPATSQARRVDTSTVYLYQGADREQRLIEAAKKEGTVTFYTSMQTPESGPLARAFEKKYGIKAQLWRGTGREGAA